MPKTNDLQWTKTLSGFGLHSGPFRVDVSRASYRNWSVQWNAGGREHWRHYADGYATAAIAKKAAESLLARLTAAIAVKEESACSAG